MSKIFFLIAIVTFASCKQKVEQVERGFYYWKSNEWELSKREKQVWDSLKAEKLYLKMFEVDYNDELGNFPISKTNMNSWQIEQMKIKSVVPTVYLKNIVFLKSSKSDLDLLADNVQYLIARYLPEASKSGAIREFQMDCDWTPKSRDNYFYFLKKLKAISAKQISTTLRLYPYKYLDKMGIPPVDKVTLMCYNLLSPLENPSKNTILDMPELKSYLKDVGSYPVHIDVALPIYSWALVYHNEEFSDVLYTDVKKFKGDLKRERPLWYSVQKDTLIKNTYLRVGDRIKFEEIDAQKIKMAIELLKQYVHFDKKLTVTLFHLDEEQLNNFTYEELAAFYTDFSE